MGIAVDRTGLSTRLQRQSGTLEQTVDSLVVRLNECRNHFWQMTDAAPLIASQQFYGGIVLCEDFVRLLATAQFEMQRS